MIYIGRALTKYSEVDKIGERGVKSKITSIWIALLEIVCDKDFLLQQMIIESQCRSKFTLCKLAIIEQYRYLN